MAHDHHPRPRHPRRHEPTPDFLPADAVIGHNDGITRLLNSYLTEAHTGDATPPTVIGYAVGPNPSVDGDYAGGDNPPRQLLYYWHTGDPHGYTMASYDFVFAMLQTGAQEWTP